VPEGVEVENPAFDVVPAELITAIVTDRGVHRAPYDFGVREEGEDRRVQEAGFRAQALPRSRDIARYAAPDFCCLLSAFL
jgi:hypothetical protein